MRSLSRKKLLAIGFLLILLIAIPITIFFIKQQQQTKSKAAAATTLEFEPTSSASAPISMEKNKQVILDVFVNPGTGGNLINNIQMEIDYDPAKLATIGATPNSFVEDATAIHVLEGPVYSPGKITVTLSTGADPTQVITLRTKIGTLTLTTIDGTGTEPTVVSFNPNAVISSSASGEQAAENVFNGGVNAFIAIAGTVTNPSTPSVTPLISASITPSTAPIANPSATPSSTITVSPTVSLSAPTATPSSSGSSSTNIAPVCSTLEVDRSTTGTAPYVLTFTARGTDSDGTVSKITFSYGDGQVENVTAAGGIGTNTVASSISHTYQNAGTYSASAVLTDNNGGVSSGTCGQTITVNVAVAGTSSSGSTTTTDASLPATGPGDSILSIGAIVGILSVIGGMLFFIL